MLEMQWQMWRLVSLTLRTNLDVTIWSAVKRSVDRDQALVQDTKAPSQSELSGSGDTPTIVWALWNAVSNWLKFSARLS